MRLVLLVLAAIAGAAAAIDGRAAEAIGLFARRWGRRPRRWTRWSSTKAQRRRRGMPRR